MYLVRELSDQFVQPISLLGQVLGLREQILCGPQRRPAVPFGELVHAQRHAGHVLRPAHDVVVLVRLGHVAPLVHASTFVGRVVLFPGAPSIRLGFHLARRQLHFQTGFGDLILFLQERRENTGSTKKVLLIFFPNSCTRYGCLYY